MPFSYLEGPEKPIGFAVDISNAIADAVRKQTGKSNLTVGWQAVTSANRIPLLQNGTIDLECGSTTNNSARGKDVDFAINHFYTGTRLLVKKSSGIKNYADLKGTTVAITTGTTNMQVVRRYNEEKGLGINIGPRPASSGPFFWAIRKSAMQASPGGRRARDQASASAFFKWR